MILLDKKLIKSVSLALSLPSSIFVLAYILKTLVEDKIISSLTAVIILVLFIANTLFMMVWYANKNKD